jgi:hypothetical protein
MSQFKVYATSASANAEVDQDPTDTVTSIPGYITDDAVMPHQVAVAANIYAFVLNEQKNLGANDWVGSFTFDQQ